MRGRVVTAVVAVVVVTATAAALWSSRQSGDGTVNETEPELDVASDGAARGGAPVAPVIPEGREQEDWFPDLSDRNDVPGVNLDAAVDRESFNCDIDELAGRLDVEQTFAGAEGEELIESLLETYLLSGDAELQLAAGLLADGTAAEEYGDRYARMSTIERAYRIDPLNPLVLWNAAQACGGEASTGFCADSQLQVNIQTVLGNNGEYWVLVARQRFNRDDRAGALEALRRAAAAPEFDGYFMANVRMFQRAFSMIPDSTYTVQTLAAFVLSTEVVDSSPTGIGCGNESQTPPEWIEACLALGRRYESDGRTIDQRRAGAMMQARLLAAAGQQEEAEAARARRRELQGIVDTIDEDIFAVLLTDERALSLFLEEFEAGDETSAVQFIADEVERLRQDPTYTPCPDEGADD